MALVVLLRGVNVGGHKTVKPSELVKKLAKFDVVNIGAAGTFVVRARVSVAKLRAELVRRLPFETEVMICDGADIVDLAKRDPFKGQPSGAAYMAFVSVLSKKPSGTKRFPMLLPPTGRWGVKIVACRGRFVCGVYRREMKAIGQLGQIDKIFGSSATTRNWNTIRAIAEVVQSG